ncbi:hypothetical protein BLOT_011429 [Blomia tropicalis]|nr:hypothetical protein BLOT_011429 [Blomia tropicalis]
MKFDSILILFPIGILTKCQNVNLLVTPNICSRDLYSRFTMMMMVNSFRVLFSFRISLKLLCKVGTKFACAI